jgi:hypothetical protein
MIRSQKSRVMLLVANVLQQIKWLLKLIVVLLGLRAQKALFTPANCFILIRFYKNDFFNLIDLLELSGMVLLFLIDFNRLLQ